MTAIMIILLVLIIIAFGISCYALGKTDGYIEGYEQSALASIEIIEEIKNGRS